MKDFLILNGIKLTHFCIVYRSVTVCAHGIHRFKTNNLSTIEKKNAVFRVITELTENLVGVTKTIMRYFIIRTIFCTIWCMFCCHTVNIKAYRCNYNRKLTIFVRNAIFWPKTTHLRLCKVAPLI